ncbi:MAG: sulfur carrier protein ThiS [Kiritimatiellia bacterium]|jgi:sulfur carrier protein|nr:sulfur carrier protein ThiS [Kiritimatiellia bacterium]MDP6630640.1 sulfur carrier protein ThiS [Kiritimatiellia bacterium]MDP6809497.1 sulfur carrier protein ThiS [Kiritimatiellia bacterium]MDP7023826.1 sulfur carrier protein ThiS [Kiritimatiellia bacterium]
MTVQINGEATELGSEMTVTELLADQKVKMPDMVSVELNGEILDRSVFEGTVIKDGDSIEFLYFMGGGRA